MTANHYLFLFGVVLMSLSVSFAWWNKIRVLWLRQDIYDARDELFMEATRLQCHDDPICRAARHHLNALARIAHVLSIPFLANAIQLGVAEVVAIKKSDNSEVNKIVEKAMRKADIRITRFLLKETLTGLIIIPATRLLSMSWIEDTILKWVQQWRQSRAAEDAAPLFVKTSHKHSIMKPA